MSVFFNLESPLIKFGVGLEPLSPSANPQNLTRLPACGDGATGLAQISAAVTRAALDVQSVVCPSEYVPPPGA